MVLLGQPVVTSPSHLFGRRIHFPPWVALWSTMILWRQLFILHLFYVLLNQSFPLLPWLQTACTLKEFILACSHWTLFLVIQVSMTLEATLLKRYLQLCLGACFGSEGLQTAGGSEPSVAKAASVLIPIHSCRILGLPFRCRLHWLWRVRSV
jgi:type IV secretory pathway TrbL component